MAARRLLIVMVVMLAALTVATALVDIEPPDEDPGTQTEPRTGPETGERPDPVAPPGEELDARIDLDAEGMERIEARAGDDLALEVRSPVPASVEIGGLGLIRSADRDAPARFLAHLDRPGTFPVLATPLTGEGPQRQVARIEASPARAVREGANAARSRRR